MIFKGSCTAIVTPFTKDNKHINYQSLKRLLDFQLQNDTQALTILGTTGENATLTFKEKVELVSFVTSYVKKRVPIIVGSGSNNTKEACKLARKFTHLGADALLVVSPYYNKCTNKSLVAHYSKIASCTNLPIIIYNVPSRTGVNIQPNVVYELSKIKNIVGIKEASGNIIQSQQILNLVDKNRFSVYCGDDSLLLPMLSIGAAGVIGVTSNAYPTQIQQICSLFENKHIEEAKTLHLKMFPIMQAMFLEINPIPIKNALNLLGFNVGGTRLPLDITMQNHNLEILKHEMLQLNH